MSASIRRWTARLGALAALLGAGLALVPAGTAAAHPLGNFTINQFAELRLHPGSVEIFAVVDHAEIPTLQQRSALDRDADGAVSADEASLRADAECAELADAVAVSVDGAALSFRVTSAALSSPQGEAGLATTRVECVLDASADLDRSAR